MNAGGAKGAQGFGKRGLRVMVGATGAASSVRRRGGRIAATTLAVLATVILFGVVEAFWGAGPAGAQETQFLTFPGQVRAKPSGRSAAVKPKNGSPQMLVQADEVQYDYNNQVVTAAGNVQIYYNGGTIEADRVVYDQRTKRLRAEGNARLTEPDGKVSYGDVIDLSDDYRDGFIDSLRLETADDTRMAAIRADRTGANYTVFQSGVYTACEPCRDDPRKPPLWQIKAVRIIHNQSEKMMYFEDARIEFFGVPLAWFPYFSAPDPSVKRKTGFLMPITTTSSSYGFGLETPYYFALAPNYDATISPRMTTTQGPLLRGEFRMRVEDGDFTIRGAAIDQLDKDKFIRSDGTETPGFRDFRGSIESSGHFNLSPSWTWGWDAVGVTDPVFFQDYKILQLQSTNLDPLLNALTEGVTQVYLTGRGDRSYFDMRAIHYYGYSEFDTQGALPTIHPVIDYDYVFDKPVLGGELSTKFNLTSLSRTTPEFDPINLYSQSNSVCAQFTADTAQKTSANCVLRALPGNYTRVSAQADWKYQYTDPLGQVWTPFARLRGDVANVEVDNVPGIANFITPGDSNVVRIMPTVGLEYHYPFIGVESWGTQTIEPIGQLILRPNEENIGKLPNEDSQSLVFDDTNLFKVDKFAGWDREEGGGRANAGVQYTAQFNRGGYFNALFGQSYQLFGTNSYAVTDLTNTGLGSGLDKSASDYVARMQFQPNKIFSLTSRFRFDETDFSLQRLEIEARVNFDRWTASVLYGDYAAQPQLGFLTRRNGVLTSGALKLSENWVLNGGVRFDVEADKISQARFGVGYIDDCFIMSLNYFIDYTYSGNVATSQTFMFQVSLRTIGGTGFQ
jgi:LPS-assembly protein